MNWEVVAHFDNPVAAELAKNLLEENGIAAMRMDDETIADAWSRNSAQGGIKLCVRSEDLGRAELLLDHKPAFDTDEEIADAIAARPDIAADLSQPPEPFDDTTSDRLVHRAFIVTVLGLLFLSARAFDHSSSLIAFELPALSLLCVPLQLYALYLLLTVRASDVKIRPTSKWKVWAALVLNVPLWLIVIVPAVLAYNRFHSPTAAWETTKFSGLDGPALYVDFAKENAHTDGEQATELGRMTTRNFVVESRGRTFSVKIGTLREGWKTDDPRKSLGEYVAGVYGNVRDHPSAKDTTLGKYPAMDFGHADRVSAYRFKVALVGRHVVTLFAEVPRDDVNGADVRRFFGSATIE